MARVVIQKDPLGGIAPDIHDVRDGTTLVDFLARVYPDGFPTETKLYLNGPAAENEIDLDNYADDGLVLDGQVVWVVHYPEGVEILVFITVVSLIAGLVLGSIIAGMVPDVPASEDLERSQPGVGNSSNNSIAGQSNQIRLGEKIPQIYGRVRAFPDIINDAYNRYSLQGFNGATFTGKQTLTQYFVLSDGLVNISEPRIGDQSLETDGILNLYEPNDVFDYADFINGFDLDRVELLPSSLSGNAIMIDDLTILTGSGRNLTLEVTATTITLSESQDAGNPASNTVTTRLLYGFSRANRAIDFQIRSNLMIGGNPLEGTFTFEKVNGYTYNASTSSVVFEIEGNNVDLPIGSVVIPFDDRSVNTEKVLFVPPNESEFLGNVNVTDFTDLNDKSFTTPDSGIEIPFIKRAQVTGLASQEIIVNINFPQGFDVRPVDTLGALTKRPSITLEVWEVDSSGNFITEIENAFTTALGRTSPYTASYSLELTGADIVPGRFIGVKVFGVVSPPFQTLFFIPAIEDGKEVSAVFQGNLVSAGVVDHRDDYSNPSVSIAELIRFSNPGDERRPNGQFNVQAERLIPIFDPDTGTFGGEAFTMNFAEIFMHHAVTVGRIPLAQINYQELFAISDSMNPDDAEFSFTFSSKNTPLDQELRTICNAARVTMYKEGSLYRFVRDEERVKVGNLTSRAITMRDNSKSISLSTPNDQDGIEFEYIDPSTSKAAVIYVPADRSAIRPKKVKSAGIRNYAQAWRRAQYEYLRLFSQRIVRSVSTTKEGYLWDMLSRVTVYDHTRLKVLPLAEADGFFRQETEIKAIDAGVFTGSEKLVKDGDMAAEFYFDDAAVPSYQGVLIDVDTVDPRKFTIAASVDTATRDAILTETRTVAQGNQVGEKVFIYPVAITDDQLIADDYLVTHKQPDGERVKLELIRYNPNLYQFDDQEPPA